MADAKNVDCHLTLSAPPPPRNVRNERDGVTADPADAQRPIAEYCEQLHANKFTKLPRRRNGQSEQPAPFLPKPGSSERYQHLFPLWTRKGLR